MTTPIGSDDYGRSRARSRITAALTAGGALTQDADTLRQCARDMLAAVLSCRVDASSSGSVARHVGMAIDADRYLANMATEEFLSCLSKTALNGAAQANAVTPCERAKDTRAAMIRAFKQRTYLYPEARFALCPSELAGQQRWSTQMVDEQLSADPDVGGSNEAVYNAQDTNSGLDDGCSTTESRTSNRMPRPHKFPQGNRAMETSKFRVWMHARAGEYPAGGYASSRRCQLGGRSAGSTLVVQL